MITLLILKGILKPLIYLILGVAALLTLALVLSSCGKHEVNAVSDPLNDPALKRRQAAYLNRQAKHTTEGLHSLRLDPVAPPAATEKF
jgi:hypothetical protein